MLARLEQLAERRASFAFETTLAGRALATHMARLRALGYDTNLMYLWLPSADLAVERVRRRVELGEHGVPEEMVRRRYERGLRNFDALYRPLATSWRVYDASVHGPPRLIAAGSGDEVRAVQDARLWRQITERR